MENVDSNGHKTRRGILVAGAVAATGTAMAAGSGTAEADDGDPIVSGVSSSASSPTTLNSSAAGQAFRVNCSTDSPDAHALVGRGRAGYGLIALSDTHNAAKVYTGSPDRHALFAQNTATTSGAGKVIWARHESAGEGADGATAVRGIQGRAGDALLDTVRAQRWPAAGEFAGSNGVFGASSQSGGTGVVGYSESGTGMWAGTAAPGGMALFAAGNATVAGDLDVQGMVSKFGGSFRIDHPLDPANRVLSHSFVESPDMKNVYDGVAELDGDGTAVVEMPDWFEALNRDFRYQLTALGGPAPNLHIQSEVADGRFTMAGGAPGQRVSWQVTGIRQDTWASENRIVVEEDKPTAERGTYLFPDGFAGSVEADR